MSFVRILSGITGCGVSAGMCHVSVMAGGGYDSANALVPIVMAAGAAVGAVAIGHAANHRRVSLAFGLLIALLAGEGYGLLATAERVSAITEAQQTPLRDAAARHQAALIELRAAESARPAAVSRDRLDTTERELDRANEAARSQASLPGCKSNCRELLTAAVAAAQREVDGARAEIARQEAQAAKAASDRIAAARAALAAAPMPASASPFADRLGVQPWTVDLAKAALAAIGGNLMAALLIAFAAHAPRPAPSQATNQLPAEPQTARAAARGESGQQDAADTAPAPMAALPAPQLADAGDVGRFILECVPKAKGSCAEASAVYERFEQWCQAERLSPLAPRDFAVAFSAWCTRAGIRARRDDGRNVYFLDVKLAS